MFQGLTAATQSLRLTQENTHFSLSRHGLLTVSIPSIGYEGRAFLSLAFPFEKETEYVSVQNELKEEQGMIRSLSDFDDKTAAILREELKKKYFCPKIKKILKLTERNGTTYWDCLSDKGDLSFTVKDVHRSLIRADEDRLFVVDVDGCRYEIESIASLDRKSHTKIELYL